MTQSNVKQEVQDTLSKLQTLRDEIRVRIHLGGMELKEKWTELEPRLLAAERAAERASAKTLQVLHELLAKCEKLGMQLSQSEPFGGAI